MFVSLVTNCAKALLSRENPFFITIYLRKSIVIPPSPPLSLSRPLSFLLPRLFLLPILSILPLLVSPIPPHHRHHLYHTPTKGLWPVSLFSHVSHINFVFPFKPSRNIHVTFNTMFPDTVHTFFNHIFPDDSNIFTHVRIL